jgi:hypothetical protein
MPITFTQARSLGSRANLHVERTGIHFRNVTPQLVRVEIEVLNADAVPSRPTEMRLESAPLGAFIAWRPLATLTVPAVPPRGSVRVSADFLRPMTKSIGNFDRVPTRTLLTALGLEDDRPSPSDSATSMLMVALLGRSLAPDLPGLIGKPGVHWAGNLNVFLGGHAVERHMAKALRIRPAVTNVVMFMVGDGRDAYAFHLEGDGIEWEAALYRPRSATSMEVDVRSQAPIHERNWIEVSRIEPIFLAVRPPAACREGSVQVHVHQRSSGKEAIVEFSFDPCAAGPGCYTI